jgi:Cellulase (glycosyl hydrolase family 5)
MTKPLNLAWMGMAVMLGGLTFLAPSQSPDVTGSYALAELTKTRASTPTGLQANVSVPDFLTSPRSFRFEDPIRETGVSTYTHFFPLVFNSFAACSGSPFGIQIYQIDPTIATIIAQMGACWVRIPLNWAQIEPANTTPQSYQWPTTFDRGLAQLSASNVKIILTLSGNPSWAATYPGGPVDKAPIGELVEFMEAAVVHYGVQPYNVKYWEFYNEPDNGSVLYAEAGWGFFGNQPEVYVDMLAAVYQPMKAADPEAQIVMGGLAYDWWSDEGGPFIEGFLDGVLQNEGGGFFDVMNFHYYPAFSPKWEPYGTGIIGKATYLWRILATYSVDKPFVCTESGMPSSESVGGSDELQSRYVVQLFSWAMVADLDPTIWYMLTDLAVPGSAQYGLLSSDLSPKPSYNAYTTLVRQLSGANYVRTLDSVATGSTEILAYEFLTPDGPTRIIVAWTMGDASKQMPLWTDHVVMVDKFGGESTIYDQDDGSIDGRVWLTIGPSPVFLRTPYKRA